MKWNNFDYAFPFSKYPILIPNLNEDLVIIYLYFQRCPLTALLDSPPGDNGLPVLAQVLVLLCSRQNCMW